MLTKCSAILRILTLVVFLEISYHPPTPPPKPDVILYFLSSYGTYSFQPSKSFQEQMLILTLDLRVSRQMFHPFIQLSWKFQMFYWQKNALFQKVCFKNKKNMHGTTKTQIRWLKCMYFKSCWQLSEPANYGLSTRDCS